MKLYQKLYKMNHELFEIVPSDIYELNHELNCMELHYTVY